ncbi:MAG: class I SAM-dependent methyltransferase [Methylacidiphilales bacterium]|nr:class I SAM-dependent methyltransferase [Candidatus Methylacidiphilales bacterium]
MPSDTANLTDLLTRVAREYPPSLVPEQVGDVPRIKFHIEYVLKAFPDRRPGDLSLCDLGGGIGLFSVGCAAAGFGRVVLVDDFRDRVNKEESSGSVFSVHEKYGVEVVSRDVIASGIADLGGGFDAITSFDSMEHWHHSPKRLFRQVMTALKPGGLFFLAVPNAVNARKRLTVPLGLGKWSSMESWYEEEIFRGHVREPDVDDLRYIARDMGLIEVEIIGRNWLGMNNHRAWVRAMSALADRPLRLWPSLCSDLYLAGRKLRT